MSEKNIDTSGEKINENQTVDRRTYLKLAGAAGSGLGAGVGTGALGTEFTTPVRAESGTVVDDFTYSSGGLSDRYHLDQDAGNATVATASTVASSDDDSNVLEIKDDTSVLHAYQGDSKTDLNAYPEIGDTFSCWIRESNGTGIMNFSYGVKDKDNKYYVQLNLSNAHLGLFKYVNGSGESLAGDWSNSTIENNTGWFEVEIQWTTDHTHTVTLYQNGSQITSFSYTEGSSDPKFTANGVGFAGHLGTGETAQFDYATTTGSSTPKNKVSNVDDFEVADKEFAAYSFDRGKSGADIVADSETTGKQVHGPTYSGTRALRIKDSSATEMISLPGDGLENYPEAGDTFECYVKATGGADNFNLTWGVQGHADRYYIKVKPSSDAMYLFKYKDNDGTVLDSTSGLSMSQDTWYYLEVTWGTDGTQTVELYDLEENHLGKCSATDTEWTSGGIGFDAYLNSGEAVHFDDFVIEEQDGQYTGGWGPNHVPSYNAKSVDRAVDGTWDKINDFHWYLNYSGAGEEIIDGEEYIVHEFQAGGLFNTYYRESSFEYDPTQKDLDPLDIQDSTKIRGEITNNASNTTLTSNDDASTWAYAIDHTEWAEWKDNDSNWKNEDGFDEFKSAAQTDGPITENHSDNVTKTLYFAFDAFIALTAPSGVAVAISTLEFLGGLAYDPEPNCNLTTDDETADLEITGWDWCSDMAMAVCTRSFEVEVKKGSGDSTLVIQHEVAPSENYEADNICEWEINCPDTKKNASWIAETLKGDLPLSP